MSRSRTGNQEGILAAQDSVSQAVFYVKGNSTDGSINVAVTSSVNSSVNANCYTGQVTVSTSQVQINAVSHALSNGIIVKAPSTNAVNIYIGLTGVTSSTGDMLEPGDVRGYAVNNVNLLYIISASSTTDIITYSAN